MVGGYEPNPFARWIDGVPWEHGSKSLPPDYDRFEILRSGAIRRIPFLERAGIITSCVTRGVHTGLSTRARDTNPGGAAWLAAGMSLNGYGGAGGMGKLMAEWIVEGEPSKDVYAYRATLWQLFQSRIRRRTDWRASSITTGSSSRTMRAGGRFRTGSVRCIIACRRTARSSAKVWLGARQLLPARSAVASGRRTSASGAGQSLRSLSGWGRNIRQHGSVWRHDLTSFGKVEVSGKDALASAAHQR